MSIKFSYTLKGDKAVIRLMERVKARYSDFSGLFKEIVVPWFRDVERDQFASEGAAGGTVWMRLTARYAREKMLSGHGGQMLVRTDALRSSLVATTGHSIVKISKTQITLGSKLMQRGQYGWFAQHGFMAPSGRGIPPRKPIQIAVDQERKLIKDLEKVLFFGRTSPDGLMGPPGGTSFHIVSPPR